ncbi:MAG TPA: thioesterase family protein [Dongiaceae bacterium]|jgi:acyl-CoA thioester hydrolase|nr:thioesterase family protein [Dongiaceae bacterium]
MPRIFRQDLTVTEDATDEFGHVNNQRYVAWMQDVATGHSTANGWPMARYLEIGAAWVVRSHFIEYLRPAFPGDRIEIFTWAASLELREVSRGYLFRRVDDRRILARAETKWVYVDLKSGRPKRVPEELMASFEAVSADDPELAALTRN